MSVTCAELETHAKGWQCPCCRVVYAPSVVECRCQAASPAPPEFNWPTETGWPVPPPTTCGPFFPDTSTTTAGGSLRDWP